MGTIALFITVFILLCIFARECPAAGDDPSLLAGLSNSQLRFCPPS